MRYVQYAEMPVDGYYYWTPDLEVPSDIVRITSGLMVRFYMEKTTSKVFGWFKGPIREDMFVLYEEDD